MLQTIWSFETVEASNLPGVIAPDYQVEFVFFIRGQGSVRVYGSGECWKKQPQAFAFLQTQGCIEVCASRNSKFIAFRTNLATAQLLLGLQVIDFSNQCIDLVGLLGAIVPRLIYDLSLPTRHLVPEYIQNFVRKRLANAQTADLKVISLYDMLLRHGSRTSIGDFASEVGLTKRSLERKIRYIGGSTPKRIAMVGRFLSACNLIRISRGLDFTGIAHRLDYSDHAHFSNDFRAFAGLSPKQFNALNTAHMVNPESL